MANQFLVEIHGYVSRQIEAGLRDRDKSQGRGDEDRLAFIDGKLSELRQIRTFLSDNFDLVTQKYY